MPKHYSPPYGNVRPPQRKMKRPLVYNSTADFRNRLRVPGVDDNPYLQSPVNDLSRVDAMESADGQVQQLKNTVRRRR